MYLVFGCQSILSLAHASFDPWRSLSLVVTFEMSNVIQQLVDGNDSNMSKCDITDSTPFPFYLSPCLFSKRSIRYMALSFSLSLFPAFSLSPFPAFRLSLFLSFSRSFFLSFSLCLVLSFSFSLLLSFSHSVVLSFSFFLFLSYYLSLWSSFFLSLLLAFYI